jgi:hypothetical protein
MNRYQVKNELLRDRDGLARMNVTIDDGVTDNPLDVFHVTLFEYSTGSIGKLVGNLSSGEGYIEMGGDPSYGEYSDDDKLVLDDKGPDGETITYRVRGEYVIEDLD